MLAGRIPNATRHLGAPPDWKEPEHGICGFLAIKDQPAEGGLNHMISAWEPTPEELVRIAAGAPVLLWIVETVHPPVMLTVGRIPQDGADQ
jgi:hypothetical protein